MNEKPVSLSELFAWALSGAKQAYESDPVDGQSDWNQLSDEHKLELLAHELLTATDLPPFEGQIVRCGKCLWYVGGECNACSPFVHDYCQTCPDPDDFCSYGRLV